MLTDGFADERSVNTDDSGEEGPGFFLEAVVVVVETSTKVSDCTNTVVDDTAIGGGVGEEKMDDSLEPPERGVEFDNNAEEEVTNLGPPCDGLPLQEM